MLTVRLHQAIQTGDQVSSSPNLVGPSAVDPEPAQGLEG